MNYAKPAKLCAKSVYLSFKEFVGKYGLKNEATSNIKVREILDILKLNSTEIYMRDDKLSTKSGIVNLHPTKGTHWVMFSNQTYFDSYGCPPPINIMKQTKNCLYSEYQFQKNDSYCAAYCLYILYITQHMGLKMQS